MTECDVGTVLTPGVRFVATRQRANREVRELAGRQGFVPSPGASRAVA